MRPQKLTILNNFVKIREFKTDKFVETFQKG